MGCPLVVNYSTIHTSVNDPSIADDPFSTYEFVPSVNAEIPDATAVDAQNGSV